MRFYLKTFKNTVNHVKCNQLTKTSTSLRFKILKQSRLVIKTAEDETWDTK